MRVKLAMMSGAFLIVSMLFFYVVAKEWHFQYDAHGRYVSPEGVVFRESENEIAFLLFCFFAVLSVVTAYFARKRND